MHSSPSDINHVAGRNLDPVEQFFGALRMDRLLELGAGCPRFQAEADLRIRPCMGNIPALGLSPRLADGPGVIVRGMHLDRQFLVGKKEFGEKGEASGLRGCISHQAALILRGDICQRLPRERSVLHPAVVACEPGFPDFSCKGLCVDRREIKRSPRSRVEQWLHQEWVEFGHTSGVYVPGSRESAHSTQSH